MLASHDVRASRSRSLTIGLYGKNMLRRDFSLNALRVAFIVGSLVFLINHGDALVRGQMNHKRWLSVAISYIAPYAASIYGQSLCQLKSNR